jgi:hypothetical protein
MSSDGYTYPVAVSQLGEQDSREAQNTRAVKWLLEQAGGSVVVVTPQKDFEGESLRRLIALPGTKHLSWRALSMGSLADRRVIYAWPDRQHLNDLWGIDADALVVIEWGREETAEWIQDANPIRILRDRILQPWFLEDLTSVADSLPKDVDQILDSIAAWAAGYDTGLKWNEEDKLKADMMNCPQRWASVTVEQVRAKCRELKMRPNDIDTIAGFLQRRKEGRRFNVRSSYRNFRFS